MCRFALLWLAVLGAGGCAPSRLWFFRSPDRAHLVEVYGRGRNEQWLRLDGVDGAKVQAVGVEQLAWSARHGLAAPLQRDGRWWVQARGAEAGPFDGIGELAWSPNGEHLAFCAARGGGWVVVRDGESSEAFDALFEGALRWSADSAHLAWAGLRAGQAHAVLDGRAGPAWDGVGRLTFGGGRFAYAARRGSSVHSVVDGEVSASFDSIAELSLGPGAGRAVVLGKREGLWHAVVDGEDLGGFDALGPARFSANGESTAWFARTGKREMVVVNGVAGADFERVRPQSVSLDSEGNTVAFAAMRGKTWQVVINGVVGPSFDEVGTLTFPSRAGDVVYAARDASGWHVVRGTHVGPAFEHLDTPQVSADGRVVAVVARRQGLPVVLVGEVEHPVEGLVEGSLVLSADGGHWAALSAPRREESMRVVVDGAPGNPVDFEELLAMVMRQPADRRSDEASPEALRAWVATELDRATKR